MTVERALRVLRKSPTDAAAWEVIALDVYQPLLAYVASLLLTFRVGAGETARDVVHDVLLAFYERWPRSNTDIPTSAALHAYLRASCRNLLVDRYRRERHTSQLNDFLTLKFAEAFRDEEDCYRSLFLEEIVKKSHSDCSQIFHLYITENLTPAEIADRLSISPSAFYARWYRCIRKAKEIIVQKKALPNRLSK